MWNPFASPQRCISSNLRIMASIDTVHIRYIISDGQLCKFAIGRVYVLYGLSTNTKQNIEQACTELPNFLKVNDVCFAARIVRAYFLMLLLSFLDGFIALLLFNRAFAFVSPFFVCVCIFFAKQEFTSKTLLFLYLIVFFLILYAYKLCLLVSTFVYVCLILCVLFVLWQRTVSPT